MGPSGAGGIRTPVSVQSIGSFYTDSRCFDFEPQTASDSLLLIYFQCGLIRTR